MISVDDYLFFVDESIDGMVAILEQLGDELANRRPDIPDANSPFALLTHCLGVMEYWVGHLVAGRDIHRDRDAEFEATGKVAELVERARAARRQLEADLTALDPFAPPRRPPILAEDAELPIGRSQGGALIHVYEELQQHRGQMEITRDVLLAASTRPA
jgi:hypothetical protein